MDNAVKLNKLIKEKSSEAQLLLLNLPPPAKDESGDYHCILFIDLHMGTAPCSLVGSHARFESCSFLEDTFARKFIALTVEFHIE